MIWIIVAVAIVIGLPLAAAWTVAHAARGEPVEG